MAVYYVTGVTVTLVPVSDAVAQLWNPASSRRIKVVQLSAGIFGDTGASTLRLTVERTTGRGATPTVTTTPDADNSDAADATPPSAAVLELGPFGTDPTFAAPPLYGPLVTPVSATNQQPFFDIPVPRGIWVPPGSGVAVRLTAGESMTNWVASAVFED